ncbi:muscle M-line assembly protein unc-89-like [Fundulus heteroclitus]|uniref:muscle M-line assembly protein unc-89-like n=1 Tax=Fundulus heteroclitus TaxID=8078 RepID=UPI00165CBB8D|nr:muscle M-line assembly protein unc-89-like [Fundulus heteroclitus]
MRPDALVSGNFSLTLKEPQLSDSGIYICSIIDEEEETMLLDVQLHVKVYKVEVDSGVESVLLPFKTAVRLPEEVTVMWRNNSDWMVHSYRCEDGQQHWQYEDRTNMKINLKSGDFSLTLKNPTDRDSGIYTCTVSHRWSGKILAKKQVLLNVEVYKVEVDSGVESVLLPFKTTLSLSEEVTVTWRNNSGRMVHSNRSEDGQQHWQYEDRTEMKSGDFSLTLKNPTVRDSGTYSCTICSRQSGTILAKKQVLLNVEVYKVEVDSGVESVLLPFKTTVSLTEEVTVTWRNNSGRMVHSNRSEDDQQHWQYEDRTEMKSGDFSLTLKNPTVRDSGTYSCTVCSRQSGIILAKKQVLLSVKVYKVEVDSGVESVLLPFKTTVSLTEEVTVTWRNNSGRVVHSNRSEDDQQHWQYEDRTEMKSGDFSLTLKNPTVRDSGTYSCTVCSRQSGTILAKKQVLLNVDVYKVEVDSGVESVLLPFKTTLSLTEDKVTVTWRNNSGRVVDGYDWWYKNLQQHKQYEGRTEMKMNYKSGDFSLSLKNPTDRDSGTYSCTVYDDKSGKLLAKKQVLLKVKGEADSLIMAIDFGSGYSGYAFNLKPREEGGETQLKRWGKELGLDSPKTPTCILFDEHKQFLEFGYKAKTAYSNMRREEAEKYSFFEDFKREILDMVSNIKDLQPELLLPWILLCPLCPDLSSHLETVSLSELSESLKLNSDPSQISSYSQENRF